MRGALLVAIAATLASCGRKARTRAVDAGRPLAQPDQHRASAEVCVDVPPRTDVLGCQRDTDCKGPGPRPRCLTETTRGVSNVCVSDDCHRDAECGAHGLCQCTPFGDHCVAGNCRTDADCTGGQLCSPSASPSPQGACGDPRADVIGYFCHTPSDTCRAVSDCESLPGTTCIFVSPLGHWQCMANHNCPDG